MTSILIVKDSSLVYVLWLFHLKKCQHLAILMLFLYELLSSMKHKIK